MASKVATDLKQLLTVKQKSRIDNTCDQYNRIFMVRLFMICTIIMAISWYSDKMNCIIPKGNEIGGDFVSSACWIQGVYVYEELTNRVNSVGYFGIPKDMDEEGIMKKSKELCHLRPKLLVPPSPDCTPMKKTFFLQYQYMPFLVGAFAILYYLPYVAFYLVNKDKQQLKDAIKKLGKSVEEIVEAHFLNSRRSEMTKRVVLNIAIKGMYILSNFLTFIWLDDVLNQHFSNYGNQFIKWSRLNNTLQYDYMGIRHSPKPGNVLLPPFGYCEVYESARDVKTTVANSHKFVCEISQHTLYQYCLLVMWFGIIGGFITSICGFINQIMVYSFLVFRCDFKALHLRQLELLEYVRARDKEFYEQCKKVILGGDCSDYKNKDSSHSHLTTGRP